jgi:putative nucleotidyltransferase with HDIG domain
VAEVGNESSELRAIRRRFAEASRRAELIALVNVAEDEHELGRGLIEELRGAFEAQAAFLLDTESADDRWRLLGAIGLTREQESTLTGVDWTDGVPADTVVPGHLTLFETFVGGEGRLSVVGVARVHGRPFDDSESAMLEGISTSVGQALERIWSLKERERLITELESLFLGTVQSLANALEAKHRDTADHALSMVDLAVEVGRRLGFSEAQLHDLRYAAIFHDIGKIATPDAILNKPGPLDSAELRLIRQHTIFGEQILAPVPMLSGVRKIVRHDHERWDGDGYPDGLTAEEIPLSSRIVFVVDAYNAMISDRPYREAMPSERAVEELRGNAGSQFDPRIVNAFLRVLEGRSRAA